MRRNELIETAILGLDRRPLPAELTSAAPQADEDAAVLLRALARSHYHEKAARSLFTHPHPPATPDIPDAQCCSRQSARHLDAILDGPYEPALEEFLNAMTPTGKLLPPRALPRLLDRALKDEQLAGKILPLAGSRGAWLAEQAPKWRHFFRSPDPSRWPTASIDERLDILKYLRTSQPDEGLHLLLSTWQEDGLRERVKLLQLLENGLSSADEPFLESCLDDKRKEVRQIAALLLAHIPGSALSRRLMDYAQSMFKTMPGNMIEIHPPETLPVLWQRDGMESTGGSSNSKASLIRLLFSRIDPGNWEQHFNQTPQEILRQFSNGLWSSNLIEGLLEATLRFRKSAWADALLWNWESSDREQGPAPEWVSKISGLISSEMFESIAWDHVRINPGWILPETSTAFVLLSERPAWSEKVSLKLIEDFRKWLAQSNGQNWGVWHYRGLLRKAAFRCPVTLLPQLEKEWPMESRAWYYWEKDVHFFLRALAFRREMLEALDAQP